MIGQSFKHYTVLAKLGEGGMGVVYQARDAHLDRLVAIKVIPGHTVADPERKRRFAQEARAASALNHPNIITIYDIDSADGVDFIAMEYVEGQTLAHRLGRSRLEIREALTYAIADRRCARCRAPRRDHPSRSQTGEYHGDRQRADQGARFRSGQADRAVRTTRIGNDAAWPRLTPPKAPWSARLAYMSPEQSKASRLTRDRISSVWRGAL